MMHFLLGRKAYFQGASYCFQGGPRVHPTFFRVKTSSKWGQINKAKIHQQCQYRERWVQDIHLPKSHEIISSISLPFSMQLLFKSIFFIWSKVQKSPPKNAKFHPAKFLPQKFAEMHVPALVVHHWWPVNIGNQGPRASKFHLITPPKPQLCGEILVWLLSFCFFWGKRPLIITSNRNLNSDGISCFWGGGEREEGWKVNMEFHHFSGLFLKPYTYFFSIGCSSLFIRCDFWTSVFF